MKKTISKYFNILKQVDEVNEKRRKEEEHRRTGERMYTRD